MKRLLAAATVLATSLAVTAPVFAIGEEMTMLETAVKNELAHIGIRDVSFMSLTVGQLAAIKDILDSDDNENEKRQRIEAVLAR